MNKPKQKCRLCHNFASLRKSHVIPEFCFKPLYDQKGRAIEVNISCDSERFIQKGFREPLFCEECEQRFGKLEAYFAKEWIQSDRIPVHIDDPKSKLEIIDLDYTKFKLFHHSILYRASVSSLDFFKSVTLGKDEEVLRQMLLNGDAGNDRDFHFMACILFNPKDHRVATSHIIIGPKMGRRNGHDFYTFIFGGCHWIYYGSRTQPESGMPVFGPAGNLYLFPLRICDDRISAACEKYYRSKHKQD